MRIESVARRFFDHAALFSCPLCGASVNGAPPAALRCEKGHCFNLSARGYADFLTGAKVSKYDRPLFESRRAVFEAGFYQPVAAAVRDAVSRAQPCCPVVADIGCGDGYYSLTLQRELPGTYVALDLVREAVALGARGGNDVLWCAGDLARLPLRSRSVDVLLDILTPSNYAEFSRVLKPDGLLLKVIPGPDYLRELRALLDGRLRTQSYSEGRVRDYLRAHMALRNEQRVTYTLPITPGQARHFARMTPMTLGVDVDALDLTPLTHITIDLILLHAYRPVEQDA